MPYMQQRKASKKLNREKIWRAWRSNVRMYADEEFVMGDIVYYRRQKFKEWHCPAKVLGEESQCVLIRHGKAFYRIHLCHLVKAKKEFGSPRIKGNKNVKTEIDKILKEEDEGQHNQSFHINREELKDNSKKPSRGKVVEYKMKGSNE